MNISNYYWYFSGVLTPRFCDDVIAYANKQKEVMADVRANYTCQSLGYVEMNHNGRVKDIELVLYEDGRHEMLNETNKMDVYQMILNWITSKFNV